jgi:hypothetical protein
MKRNRIRLWLTIFLFFFILLLYKDRLANIIEPGSHGMDKIAMREMLGTFTDPRGTPGNFICFELVPSSVKADPPFKKIDALKGDGHLHEMLGFSDLDFVWGYNEWDPRLKISLVPKQPPGNIEPAGKGGRVQITAEGHAVINIKVLPGGFGDRRVKDLFDKIYALPLSRTKEPQYPPPNF